MTRSNLLLSVTPSRSTSSRVQKTLGCAAKTRQGAAWPTVGKPCMKLRASPVSGHLRRMISRKMRPICRPAVAERTGVGCCSRRKAVTGCRLRASSRKAPCAALRTLANQGPRAAVVCAANERSCSGDWPALKGVAHVCLPKASWKCWSKTLKGTQGGRLSGLQHLVGRNVPNWWRT